MRVITTELPSSGSQEERISILRMALAQKGVPVGAHCANGTVPPPAPEATPEPSTEQSIRPPVNRTLSHDSAATLVQDTDVDMHDDGGIDL